MLPQKRFGLEKEQWKVIASTVTHIAEAILIFSLAAFFVPEAVGLEKDFSRIVVGLFFASGLTTLTIAVILTKRGI